MVNYYNHSNNSADFGFKIEFVTNTQNPERIFNTFLKLIEFSRVTDKYLIKSLDIDIEVNLILKNIEQGSIIIWLQNFLDNKKFPEINERGIIAYLIQAKSIIIEFLDTRNTIKSSTELLELQERLRSLATITETNQFGIYTPPNNKDLLSSIDLFQRASSELQESEKLYYIAGKSQVSMNQNFNLSPNEQEKLLIGDCIRNELEMILKVKKPDYLGESKWEFRYAKKTIKVKINDLEWLEDFRHKKIIIAPGDAIKAIIEVITTYDYQGEVTSNYTLQKVLEVIPTPPTQQLSLFGESNDGDV
ncbi:hypothetical protein [Planktothrix mougeotii]|uniref:Uncharacterized protein n=1 Tax=Planktothrix mougeotii LEGE 06226 TaxID=1828728 RepID=A0ABR9U6K0_9CYAN|nr:hypothetical protein [Planktothrix mougeotii]MBE9141724.1 hypothetical protein [Planktothrix mougeotii LEGE 06226]